MSGLPAVAIFPDRYAPATSTSASARLAWQVPSPGPAAALPSGPAAAAPAGGAASPAGAGCRARGRGGAVRVLAVTGRGAQRLQDHGPVGGGQFGGDGDQPVLGHLDADPPRGAVRQFLVVGGLAVRGGEPLALRGGHRAGDLGQAASVAGAAIRVSARTLA